MDRKEEIKILIQYLKNDVIKTSIEYSSLLENTIVQNGILISKYNKELEQIQISKNNKSK